MLEGLAVWALLIYLLRLVGMPWNKATKMFAYLGGMSWLMFVWVGLINYAPMDLSGGSVVQSPHIQLKPDNINVNGKVKHIYVQPNQDVKKGQLIYEIENEPYKIALKQARVAKQSALIAFDTAQQNVEITKLNHQSLIHDEKILNNERSAANSDYELQAKMLKRYETQNQVAQNTISQSVIDKQKSAVEIAKQKVNAMTSKLRQNTLGIEKAKQEISRSILTVQSKKSDYDDKIQLVAKAEWDLKALKYLLQQTDLSLTLFCVKDS